MTFESYEDRTGAIRGELLTQILQKRCVDRALAPIRLACSRPGGRAHDRLGADIAPGRPADLDHNAVRAAPTPVPYEAPVDVGASPPCPNGPTPQAPREGLPRAMFLQHGGAASCKNATTENRHERGPKSYIVELT